MRARRWIFALAVALLATACASLPNQSANVSPTSRSEQPFATATVTASATPVPPGSAAIIWQEPTSYSFTLSSQCGERALIGTFNVEVQGGETVGVEAVSGYFVEHPEAMPPSAVPTLNDLLAEAADARSRDADEVRVVLDPIDGHPVSISIDWKTNTIDDEACYEITNYLPAE